MAKLSFGKNLWTTSLLCAVASASFLLANPAQAATYNVKTYGATGNGVTDDSQAIADAITAAGRSMGNTVEFPKGNYLIGSAHPTLSIGTQMTLHGDPKSVLEMSDSNSQILVTGHQVSIDTLSIANTGSDKSSGIAFDAASDGFVKNSTFTGWINGVTARNSSQGIGVDRCNFYMPMRETGVLVQTNSSVKITNNQFNSLAPNYGYGVYSDATNNAITITNNKFDSLGYSVYVQGDDLDNGPGSITGSDNTFENCYYGYDVQAIGSLSVNRDTIKNATYGIYGFFNKSLQVTNCTIISPTYIGIYVGYPLNSNTMDVSNNVITDASGAYGIWVTGNASVTNNKITAKTFQPFPGVTGIYANDNLTNSSIVKINGNTISGVCYGVQSYLTQYLKAENNHISKTQSCGIYTSGDKIDDIEQNDLHDCALIDSSAYAVIYVNGFTSGDVAYTVTDNSYTAQNTHNLTYFVYVNGTGVYLSNNQTNTMLPSYP